MAFTINFKPQDPLTRAGGGNAQMLALSLPSVHPDFPKHARFLSLLCSQINQISGVNNEAGEHDVNANGPTATGNCAHCNNLSAAHMPKDKTPVVRGFLSDFEAAARHGCEVCRLILTTISPYQGPGRVKVYIRPGAPLNIIVACATKNARYDLFTPIGQPPSPWPEIGSAPLVTPNVLKSDPVSLIRSWIADCRAHPACQRSHLSNISPKRVLSFASGFLRLEEPINLPEPYIALSHCWGMSSIPKATKSNIEQLKAGVEWDILTRTFQETLLLAVKLGIKYVWIDSLCIIQDDDQDWKEQAAKMADIYENAELVISATNASDGSMGLFQDRKPAQILASDNTPSSWTVREPGSSIQVIPLHGPECKDKDCPIYISRDTARHAQWDSMDGIATGSSQFNPLLGRGWAFQERLLATRIVHFADHELIWECKETQRCECMHLDRTDGRPILERSAENIKHRFSGAISRPPVAGNSPPPIDLFDLWASVVEKYTERRLTYEKDRLPALEGAIRKLQEKNLGTCVGGLFLSDLPRCLLWQVAQPGTRHLVYRAPTWSWASVMPAPNSSPRVEYLWHHRSEALGTYEYMPEQTFIEELDGIVHATTLDTEEPQYGLHFRAPMILATLHINVAASPYHDFSRGSGFVTHGDAPQNHRYTVTFNGQTVTFMHDVAIHGKPNSPVPASPVSLVAVARRTNQAKPDQALVLRRLESTEDYAAIGMQPQKFTDPMYSRIGIITSLEEDTKGWFDDAEQKQLVLF